MGQCADLDLEAQPFLPPILALNMSASSGTMVAELRRRGKITEEESSRMKQALFSQSESMLMAEEVIVDKCLLRLYGQTVLPPMSDESDESKETRPTLSARSEIVKRSPSTANLRDHTFTQETH